MGIALTNYPVLTSFLTEAGLQLVDIGGRGSEFGPIVPLAPFSDYFVSEPDREEAARLADELPRHVPWRSVTVMTEAIASQRGEADLYLTQRPGMNSLLEPDPRVASRFFLEETFRVVAVSRVPTLPLDEAALAYGFTDACFLKLDTQGTELDILQSGSRLLTDSLLGVFTEAHFRPFYKGQALFADVDHYLRDHGFSLFSVSRTGLRRLGYEPTLYSGRVITWAHCLYFREPEGVAAAGDARARRATARLLGLAITFEHYDLAFEIVGIARQFGLRADADLDRLVAEVQEVARLGTKRMMRKAARRDLAAAVLAPTLRDKREIE